MLHSKFWGYPAQVQQKPQPDLKVIQINNVPKAPPKIIIHNLILLLFPNFLLQTNSFVSRCSCNL